MGELSPVEALRILRAAGEVALRDDDGHEVPITIQEAGPRGLRGTAPRLAVHDGMALATRLVTPDGEPWQLRFVIQQAVFATHETAAVTLTLEQFSPDARRRMSPRLRTGGKAWLIAVSCQDVVDGDRVDGVIHDISLTGVAFASSRVLRLGDRLTFHGRFFSDTVLAEARVASIRPSAIPERSIYGCHFIEIDQESRDRIGRMLHGERPPSADLSLIHGLVEQQREAHRESPRRRRFLR